jgi:hypothetical protein
VQENAYLFTAQYDDGLEIEIQVNPEFGSRAGAQVQADFYAPIFGRLPTGLRRDVQTSWIHQGDENFGGGNNNLLIHTGSVAQGYINRGILEETLVHEAAHTSLDSYYANHPQWRAAQQSDPDFISTFAEDFPDSEDIAESFLPYLAVRDRADRISSSLEDVINNTIPARIVFFDGLKLDMHPLVSAGFEINAGLNDAWFNLATNGQGFLITVFPDRREIFLAWFTYDTERPPEDVTALLGEPGHRWLTAQGPYNGDTATLTIFVTEGGVFDSAEPAASTDPAGDGTMTIEFADCTEGLVSYEITSLDISGEIPIQRIVPDNVALCEMLASP